MIQAGMKPKRKLLPTIRAELPACPSCGAKDTAIDVGKTYRPFGPESDVKVQYCDCRCGKRFKIQWE